MKKKYFSKTGIIILLIAAFSLGTIAYAASYSGKDVYPGLSDIEPGDDLTFSDNTDWATFTACWGVRVTFLDWDRVVLQTELLPIADGESADTLCPPDPSRNGWDFIGWERNDTGPGTADLHSDGTVDNIDGPGPIIFIAVYKERPKAVLKVKYEIQMDAVYGIPEDVRIPDEKTYNPKDPVTIEANLVSHQMYAIDSRTGEVVPGSWEFVPWDKEDFMIEEDTVVSGAWVFTPGRLDVIYVVRGDEKYGMPEDAVIPNDATYAYKEAVIVAQQLVSKQKYAIDPNTGDRVPGSWKFTPWDKTDFVIRENTVIRGAWTFTPDSQTETTPPSGTPKTGDATGIALWAALLAVSGAVCGAVLFKGRKGRI